jgi:hemerythrin-like metal-binding protein
MALLQWDQEYSVNIPDLDEQHKKIFSLIDTLHDAMCAGKGRVVVGTVLTDLLDYTATHFAHEERLFAEYAYPQAEIHMAEHEKLVQQVKAFKAKYDAGNAQITVDVMLFLKNWLNNHIHVLDKKYSAYLNAASVNG